MTSRERAMSERYGREQKAARLAVTLAVTAASYVPPLALDEMIAVAQEPRMREELKTACGYGHVSDETWERVVALLKEVPR